MNKYLDIQPEVQKALENQQAVVALESTIISHGMPYPKNLETALQVEQVVRDHGAIPATIALMDGQIKIGLSADEISFLAKEGPKVIKTSRRDMPYILSKKLTGATTVSATMIAAQMAGIKVFATGGIGGVHRGAEKTFDISADLQELAKTNVAVVCAGIKSILDLGLTLEYLETMGVPVLGYQTDELPAFYTRQSGFKVDFKMDTPKEIAELLKVKWETGLNGGVVIANPVPEQYALDAAVMHEAISKALQEHDNLGIKGKASTPFLLAKVKELTGGESLVSNIELVLNNAKLAADIAKAL
ncbi:MAG TPA: pseudouridine-5'-phosphate glycosidase [Flavobacteriales bacterium]|jgi:pseudouridine-5'-phosphate glycosidase|nr:pseudouridine-5'-phosphate glycosidase [Flavobacteriales bacterium]